MTRGERLAAGALLLAVAVTGWDVMTIGDHDAAAAAPPPPRSPARRGGAGDEDRAMVVVEKSLFAPDRHDDFSSVAGRPGAVGGHLLRGVVFGADGGVALFEPVRGGPARRLRVGAVIGGYRIAAIEEASVVLDRDGRRRRVSIDDTGRIEDVASPASPPPSDAPPPPAPVATSTMDPFAPPPQRPRPRSADEIEP